MDKAVLHLILSDDAQAKLADEAEKQGVSSEQLAQRLLHEVLEQLTKQGGKDEA